MLVPGKESLLPSSPSFPKWPESCSVLNVFAKLDVFVHLGEMEEMLLMQGGHDRAPGMGKSKLCTACAGICVLPAPEAGRDWLEAQAGG